MQWQTWRQGPTGAQYRVAAQRRRFCGDRKAISVGEPTHCGPVCKQAKLIPPKICFVVSRSPSVSSGRSSAPLATRGTVCISTDSASGAPDDANEAAAEPPLAASSSPVVTGSKLVPFAHVMGGNYTESNPGEGRPAQAAVLAREPGAPDALPVADAHAYPRQEGYSSKVLEHLDKARAGTTRAVYASKWSVFAQHCPEHDINA